eukprot:8127774-Ditylum_brightwellii.AAC.1
MVLNKYMESSAVFREIIHLWNDFWRFVPGTVIRVSMFYKPVIMIKDSVIVLDIKSTLHLFVASTVSQGKDLA